MLQPDIVQEVTTIQSLLLFQDSPFNHIGSQIHHHVITSSIVFYLINTRIALFTEHIPAKRPENHQINPRSDHNRQCHHIDQD